MRIAKRLTYPPSGYPWPHRVAGTLTADNLPVQGRKRVAALDRKTLFVGGTTISEPGGAFLFRGLPELPPGHGGWLIVAQDNLIDGEPNDGTYNAVVGDLIAPEMGD